MEQLIEKAIVVGAKLKKPAYEMNFESSLAELQSLVATAGGKVVATLVQNLDHPFPATYIGRGKMEELKHLVQELEPDLVIFDQELSAVQLRNLEGRLEVKIIDRTMLILDIFSQRARSKEGKLQVELARLEYRLPRLAGIGKEMSRLGGGIGTRGAGEQKLEMDRRYLRKRIHELKKQMQKIDQNRILHQVNRRRAGLKQVSLVGYTNAGKSSLFNSLCCRAHPSGREQVEAGEQLFQTLDPTTRKIRIKEGLELLITDTVGFIQNLPHHLVAAFRATLEEAAEADLILQVVDISEPYYLDRIKVVEDVLVSLGADKNHMLTVFNKVDRIEKMPLNGNGMYISALTGQGIEKLLINISERLQMTSS